MDERQHVLIIEDEAPVARLYRSWVELEGATVATATSAEQGLLLAAIEPPAVALCDIRLPGGRDGYWFVSQVRRLHPETAIVMTTGLNDFEAAVAGLRAGVTDYIVKPFGFDRLKGALRRALADYAARRAALERGGSAQDDRAQLSIGTTSALLAILQSQDGLDVRHAQRVAYLATRLAREMGLDEEEVSHIEHAALLSEVPRVDIYAMAPRVRYLSPVAAIAVAVQERFDGTGFPAGRSGEAIPLGARIIAVAAAYEELITRSSRQLRPVEALEALCAERAHEFDPVVLDALRMQMAASNHRNIA